MIGNGQRNRSYVGIVFCLSAILLLGAFASAQQAQRDKVDSFAKCLTRKNATMYGNLLCSHCDDQRKMFGESFKFIHYVECSQTGTPQDVNTCKISQVRYTPTWILGNGERLVGVQTFKQLGEKTGCPLP